VLVGGAGAWRPYHNRACPVPLLVCALKIGCICAGRSSESLNALLYASRTCPVLLALLSSRGLKPSILWTLTLTKMECVARRVNLGLKGMVTTSPDNTLLFAIHTFTRDFNPGEGHPVEQRPVELGVLCKPVRHDHSWCS
jgi:hypothetical protein